MMTIADIYEAIYLCPANTLMAYAFRKAVGCCGPRPPAQVIVQVDKYEGAEMLMGQRYGVRM